MNPKNHARAVRYRQPGAEPDRARPPFCSQLLMKRRGMYCARLTVQIWATHGGARRTSRSSQNRPLVDRVRRTPTSSGLSFVLFSFTLAFLAG